MRRDIVTRMKYLARGREEKAGPRYSQRNEPQLDVDAQVALILLLNVFEHKVERLRLSKFSRGSDFLRERKEFLVVTAVVKQFCDNGRLSARQ